jgi:hypothetical protein
MGDDWEFLSDFSHFLDGVLDSLARRLPSGSTSFEEFSSAK